MDIERTCYNCEISLHLGGYDECGECNFEPRRDIVDLHGKLRKAVEAIETHRKIITASRGYCIGDTDYKLWKVLEELR